MRVGFYEGFMLAAAERRRAFTPGTVSITRSSERGVIVDDLIYLALGGALFIAFGLYGCLLGRL